MVYYCYKCAAKVIILILFSKCFTYYYNICVLKVGQPRRTARKFGGTIADNHKKNAVMGLRQ